MAHPKSKIQNPKSDDVLEIVTSSPEETQALGVRLGQLLQAGDVVALHGELGSGKTTLIQGIAQGLGRDPNAIKSPTFVLMREYPPATEAARPGDYDRRAVGAGSEVPLVHIDGYRLSGAPAAAWLDVELMFSPSKITLIEWAERFGELLPEHHLEIQLNHVSANRRRLAIIPTGARAHNLIARLREMQPHETPRD